MNGWPFLIARGRRRGYSVLLTPAFLRDDYGLLEEVAGPTSAAEPVRVAAVRTGRGRINVAWSEHKVTAEDLADGTEPRDEHSRPLRLLYGFACQETILTLPSDVDMARSLAAALDTYRRFLADERGFTIESSAPFELRSVMMTRLPAAPRPAPAIRRRSLRRYAIPLTLAGLAVGITVVAIIASGGPDREDPPPPTETSTTTRPNSR